LNLVTGTGCTSVDIGVRLSANLELVDKFCYLGDVLSVDDADAAVEAKIQTGWNKFRQSINPSKLFVTHAVLCIELESEAVGAIAYH